MSENEKPNHELDEFHYHEAQDRAYIVCNLIEDLLVEHPAIMQNESLRTKVNTAHELILEVHQEVSSLEFTLFNDDEQASDEESITH